MTVNPKVNPKKLRPYDEPPKRRRSLIPSAPDSAAAAFMVGAVLWLAVATGLGVLAADMRFMPFELSFPFGIFDLGFELNARRVDQAFVNALVYGWLSNAGFAAATFMAPRLMGRRLVAEPGLFLAFLIWNLSVVGGIGALYVFDTGPHSALTAFPWLITGGMATAALIVTGAFLATVGPAIRSAYVSIWFIGLGLLSILGLLGASAAIGLADFVFDLPDLAVALASVFVERAVILLWLLPVALATLYYVVPRATGRPLESNGIALLSVIAWFVTAPIASLSNVIDTQVPYFVTSAASAASIALLVPLMLTVGNLVLTVRGRWSLLFGIGPAAFAAVSVAFLLAAGLLDAIGTLPSVRAFVGGTDWARGVFTWWTLGAFSLAALGFIELGLARVMRREWGGTPLSAAQLWLTFVGATIAGVALIGAGMAEGSFRAQAAAPDVVTAGLYGYLFVAFAGMGLAALGGVAAVVNVFLAYTTGEPIAYASPAGSAQPSPAGH